MSTQTTNDATKSLPENCDLLVIGSGAGGLSAAVTAALKGLNVVILEKEDVIGGTTAWSGGWLWIPRNPLAKRAGIDEDIEQARRYLKAEMPGEPTSTKVDRFLEAGPKMISFFTDNTALDFIDGNTMPDFHNTSGSSNGGRSVAAAPFDGRKLGPWIEKLRPPLDVISIAGLGVGGGQDMRHFFNATRSIKSAWYVSMRLLKHGIDLVRYGQGMQLRNGNALVAGLLRSALDAGVSIHTNINVTDLNLTDGRIVGVQALSDGKNIEIHASTGVVLATGGFPHDTKRVKALFHKSTGPEHFSAAPDSNTGDGLRMAEAIGVKVDDNLKNAAAWSPVSLVPRKNGSKAHFPHLLERAKPGFIAVTSDGKRFVNEADSYHDFMESLFAKNTVGGTPECWIIADHRAQRRWGLGCSRPFPFPTLGYERSGYLKKGRSVHALAEACGINSDTLQATISKFNQGALRGIDPDFGRGESKYNKNQGDAENTPNPSLAPLIKKPYYAVKITSGSLGTFAGVPTDSFARVLNTSQQSIPGLFAVGNDMSSIFKGYYPSGGITLGPAMTFGYIIGCFAAGEMQEEPEKNHSQLRKST